MVTKILKEECGIHAGPTEDESAADGKLLRAAIEHVLSVNNE